jgi:ABC-type nitrate/sulfonate/bicarbonate transport system substrate-binding protein
MKAAFAAAAAALLFAALIACGQAVSPSGTASSAPQVVSADGAGPTTSPGAGGADAAVPPLVPIKISNPSPAVSILPFYAAIEQGFFQKYGLDASLVLLPGRVAQTALSKSEIDFMNSTSDSVIGATNGLPFKIVYVAWDHAPWTLVGKAELRSIQDVRGKVVATNRPGSSPYAYLEAGLARAGLSANDLSLLFMNGTQDNYASLIAGTIDAAVLSPPFDAEAAERGFPEVAFLGDLLEIPYIGLATSEGYLREHRKEVIGAIRAMVDAGDWIRAYPDQAAELIVKEIGVSRSVAERSYQRMLPLLSKTGETAAEGIEQTIAVQATVSGTEIRLDPQSTVDYGPLREARVGR